MPNEELQRHYSSASVLFEAYKQRFNEKDQVNLATMDKILGDKRAGKKGGGDMADAVKSNEKIRDMIFHKCEVKELDELLDTTIYKPGTQVFQGLSNEKAKDKFDKIGPNALTEKKGLPWYILFLKEMTGFFSLLLWAGAILCFIGYGLDSSDNSNLYLGIVLATVTFITGCFSYYQSSKSAALMAQFKDFIPAKAKVYRGEKIVEVEAKTLVPGDVVVVKNGDNVPADVRVLQCVEMKVNNASLTGESDDLLRKPDGVEDNPLESPNLAFFGTQCTNGEGVGIVINTGDRTVIGQIANLAQQAKSGDTPLSIEIHRFIKLISAVAIILGVVFFIFGFIFGYDVITNIVFAIGIIVANVPEGLLATVTVSLALTAKRMAHKKVLVKNLESVETLGSTSCICSDKTGTLTQNKMTASHLWYNLNMVDIGQNLQRFKMAAERSRGSLAYNVNDPEFRDVIRTVALGSKCTFNYQPEITEIQKQVAKILKIGRKTPT